MKRICAECFVLISLAGIAQTPGTAPHTSLAEGLGVFVFPAKNQDQKTQDDDEAFCYKWAVEHSGVDPLNPPKVQAAEADRSLDGSAIGGAARGAAAGVAIGAIAGDAGKGAAIGAVAGGLAGRRARIVGDAREQQANDQAAKEQEASMMDSFKKAFVVCLEGKGYTVK